MLESYKKEVVRIAKEAQKSGLCKHKSGNFSYRDKETGLICMTPAGVDREFLTEDDICVLDIDGNLVEVVNSERRPSSETMMHLEVYKTRDELNAIAHTHSVTATAFAVLKKEIPAIVYEVSSLGLREGVIPVADYARPGTVELAKSVIEPVKKSDVFLLEKHGVVAAAQNLDEAILRAHYVEELAEIYMRALSISCGKEPEVFSQSELNAWSYPSDKIGNKR